MFGPWRSLTDLGRLEVDPNPSGEGDSPSPCLPLLALLTPLDTMADEWFYKFASSAMYNVL